METVHRPMFNCLNPTIGVEILDVVRTLKSKLEVKALYCFGIHSQTTFRKSSIYPENKINATKVHLTMFVLSNNLPSNAIADLGNQVRKETADKYKLTLLIHKPSQIKKANHKNSYLYRQIMKKGWLMQTQQPLHHLINPSESTNRSTQQIKKFTENRLYNAKQVFELEYTIEAIAGGLLKASLLHIGIEQLCLALIYTFLGYYPNHFHLEYLFDLCANCTPIVDEIFPRETKEDRTLLQILNTTPKQLRFKKTDQFTLTQLEVLEERCAKLYRVSEKEIHKQIKKIESEHNKVRTRPAS